MSLVGPQAAIAGTIDGYENAGHAPDHRNLGSCEDRSGRWTT